MRTSSMQLCAPGRLLGKLDVRTVAARSCNPGTRGKMRTTANGNKETNA